MVFFLSPSLKSKLLKLHGRWHRNIIIENEAQDSPGKGNPGEWEIPPPPPFRGTTQGQDVGQDEESTAFLHNVYIVPRRYVVQNAETIYYQSGQPRGTTLGGSCGGFQRLGGHHADRDRVS